MALDSSEDLLGFVEKALKESECPEGKVLFAAFVGTALHHPRASWNASTSAEFEIVSIYESPLMRELSPVPAPQTIKTTFIDPITNETCPLTIHEVKKFLSLINDGSPGHFELLFTNSHAYLSPTWLQLLEVRKYVCSKFTCERVLKFSRGLLLSARKTSRKSRRQARGSLLHTRVMATKGEMEMFLESGGETIEVGGDAAPPPTSIVSPPLSRNISISPFVAITRVCNSEPLACLLLLREVFRAERRRPRENFKTRSHVNLEHTYFLTSSN
eukprot:TRINITY_DN13090_c0_g1_i1.p1 TRINITY_DN13090_c0_g1~~TRINITY_DN13090_c0_g1_i1.p1  ORF type:complete len:290 (+),score=48.14 TRINITY_DN13090_c0_g1_i1:56-871(+)